MDDADFNLSSSARAERPEASFSFRRVLARQWRESVRYFGFWRALRELGGAFRRAMVEMLPSRRKARFGDLDYDWQHGADTTRSNVGFRAQLLAELAGRPYFATEPWLFDEMMRALALSIQQSAFSQGVAVAEVGLQDFTFIDLGSGKGRALLMAAQYGFKRIIGVEFMPEWHRAAEENIRKFHSKAGSNAPPIQSLCMDARDFEFPLEPLVVYMFNPFGEAALVTVLNNLRTSVERRPRTVYLAYRFTEFDGLLQQTNRLEKLAGARQWAVYGNRRNRTESP